MADSNLVTVRFGADASGIRKGASEASQHVDGLLGKIKELKSEQVAQGRIARFYASEIAELIPAADGAKQAIQQLIAVGLSGSVLGVAIEGVLFLAKQLAPLWEAQGRAIKVATDDAIKSINALDEKVKDYIASTKKETETERLRRDVLDPLLKKEAAQKQDLIEKTDELALATGVDYAAGIAVAVDQAEKLLNVTRAQIAAANVAIGGVSGADRVAQGKKERAEDAASWGKYADEIFANDEKLLNDLADVAQKNLDIIAQAREKDIQGWAKYADDIYKGDVKNLEQIEADHDKETEKLQKKWEHVADAIGSAMAQTVSSIIKGTESIGDAFQHLAERLLDMALESIFQGIFSALLGGGGGLFSFLSFEKGGEIPTAASGLDLPKVGGAIPILAHGGEAVITRTTTDRLASFLDRAERGEAGSSGGGAVNLHFPNAMFVDKRGLQELAQDPYFIRGMTEARRNGRLR